MIFAINKGHSLTGGDYGAVGHIIESKETRTLGNLVIDKLRDKGHTVIDCTVDTAVNVSYALNKIVQMENNSNAELFVSIHFNAGGGTGTEVYIAPNTASMYSNSSVYELNREIGSKVCLSISNACGWRNRGLKEDYFFVLTNTKAKAILIEVCFVDSNDYKLYNANKVATAIVNALTNSSSNSSGSLNTSISYLNLHKHNTSWRVYPLNKAPIVGNEVGCLAPAKFNGLSYKIEEDKGDIKIITTQSFGRVQIYAPRDADSSITSSPIY